MSAENPPTYNFPGLEFNPTYFINESISVVHIVMCCLGAVYCCVTRLNETRQGRQDKRQDKTRQNKTRQIE